MLDKLKLINIYFSETDLEYIKSISRTRGDYSYHIRKALQEYVINIKKNN